MTARMSQHFLKIRWVFAENCGSQDLYQVGNMCFHSFDKFAFKRNWRPMCLAYSADNQLFCFGHIDEAPMALMSGLDLRPRHYLVWLRAFSWVWPCGSTPTIKRGCQFITQPHGETMNLIHALTQNYAHCRFADYPTEHVFECGRKPGVPGENLPRRRGNMQIPPRRWIEFG